MSATDTQEQEFFTASPSEFGEIVSQFFHGGNTLAEIQGISPNNLNVVYSAAFANYNNGNYSNARTLFHFLCMFDQMDIKNWIGFAATCQMQKDYKVATTAYTIASMLDMSNLTCAFHISECKLAMGLREEAIDGFTFISEIQSTSPNDLALQAKAAAMLELIAPQERD